jgi:GTPase KRas protein
MESSAKQKINVDEAFFAIVKEIRRYNKENFNHNNLDSGQIKSPSNSGGGCCIIM